jgi:hypothetical protein
MTGDPHSMSELLEESQDLQSDALAATKESFDDLVEATQEERRDSLAVDPAEGEAFAAEHRRSLDRSIAGTTILGAAGGGLLVAMMASPASASASSPDVQMMQTAASIENLAVTTYGAALALPYIGGSSANPVVKKFCQVTKSQHDQHNNAFNAAARRLGGQAQHKEDPKYVPVVNRALANITKATPAEGTLQVVALALELENVAAETYINDMSQLRNTPAKEVTASIMGVEAQHAATLLAVQALLMADAPQDIALSPTVVASLPAAAGSVGFPHAFYPTTLASPAVQGAVK